MARSRESRAKRRVAILGGGPAGLTAALELTATAELRARHDVTVYVSGWRLGGRHASGRNPDAAWRIEARGIPILAGCDENAFRLVRAVYDELNRPADTPLASWQAAFSPSQTLSFAEVIDGRWAHWSIDFDANDGVPGDGVRTPAPWEYVALLLPWMVRFFKATATTRAATRGAAEPSRIPTWIRRLVQSTRDIRGALDPDADGPVNAWLAGWTGAYGGPDASSAAVAPPDDEAALLEAAADLVGLLCDPESRAFGRLSFAVVSLLERFMDDLWEEWADATEVDGDLRRVAVALDLACAAVCGMIRDGVLDRGFDAIDDVDYTEWLAQNGARPVTLQSALVRVVYDHNFAFEDGDPARPRIAAGAALRSVLRLLFTYKGAVFYKLVGGPGEVLFAPMYEVLRARGVRIAFFHPVRGLHLDAAGRAVERVTLGRQATVSAGPFAYEPLIDLDGMPCWPVRPLADQLAESVGDVDYESPWSAGPDVGQVELTRGEDFDDIVLALAIGTVADAAGELIAASERWREMAVGVRSVATRIAELWLRPSTAELGWGHGATVLAAFAKPFDTWVDMSHLVDAERWPSEHRPGSIAWLVSALPDDGRLAPWSDHDHQSMVDRQVRGSISVWLDRHASTLWPGAGDDRSYDWSLLVDPLERSGTDRLDAQYWRANISPDSQVALSLPGTTSLRLPADGSGFDNLVLAGSWVRTGINLGTIEASVTSGMQAARALCGQPTRIVGERDGE